MKELDFPTIISKTENMEPGEERSSQLRQPIGSSLEERLERAQSVMRANQGRTDGTVAVIINNKEVRATCIEDE